MQFEWCGKRITVVLVVVWIVSQIAIGFLNAIGADLAPWVRSLIPGP